MSIPPCATRVILIPQEGTQHAVSLPLCDAMRLEMFRNLGSDMDLPPPSKVTTCDANETTNHHLGCVVAATEASADDVNVDDIYFPVPLVTRRDLELALPMAMDAREAPTVKDVVDDHGVGTMLRLLRTVDYLGATELLSQCVKWLKDALTGNNEDLFAALVKAFPAAQEGEEEKQSREDAPTPCRKRLFSEMCQDHDKEEEAEQMVTTIPLGPLQLAFSRLRWQISRNLLAAYPTLVDVWGNKARSVGGADNVFARRFPYTTTVDCTLLRSHTPEKCLTTINELQFVGTLCIVLNKETFDMLFRLGAAKRRQIHTLEVEEHVEGLFLNTILLFPNLRTLVIGCWSAVLLIVARQRQLNPSDAEWCREIKWKRDYDPPQMTQDERDNFWALCPFMPTIGGMTPAVFALSQGMVVEDQRLIGDGGVDEANKESILYAVCMSVWRNTTVTPQLRLYHQLLRWLADHHKAPRPDSNQKVVGTVLHIARHILPTARGEFKTLFTEMLVILCGFLSVRERVKYLIDEELWCSTTVDGQPTVLPWLYIAEKTHCRGAYPLTLSCLTERFTMDIRGRRRHGCTFWHCVRPKHLERLHCLFEVLSDSERARIPRAWEPNGYGQTPLMCGLCIAFWSGGEDRTLAYGGFDAFLLRCSVDGDTDTSARPDMHAVLGAVDRSGKTAMHYYFRVLLAISSYTNDDTLSLFERQLFACCYATRDHSGRTPLQALLNPPASEREHWRGRRGLLQKTLRCVTLAGRDTVDDLLHFFAGKMSISHDDFLRLLLRAGPCVRTWRDANGNNLAHRLAVSVVADSHTLRWLALAGVSLKAHNDDGHTPLDYCPVQIRPSNKKAMKSLPKKWCSHKPSTAQEEHDLIEEALAHDFGQTLPTDVLQAVRRSIAWHQKCNHTCERSVFLCQFMSDLGFDYDALLVSPR